MKLHNPLDGSCGIYDKNTRIIFQENYIVYPRNHIEIGHVSFALTLVRARPVAAPPFLEEVTLR